MKYMFTEKKQNASFYPLNKKQETLKRLGERKLQFISTMNFFENEPQKFFLFEKSIVFSHALNDICDINDIYDIVNCKYKVLNP